MTSARGAPEPGDDAHQAAVHGVRDPELVRGALGEEPIAAVGLLIDVRLNLLGVDTDADFREPECHRPPFGDERQERPLLAFVAVREQRDCADRELPRDLHGERAQSVCGERLLYGRELAVRRAGAAERGRHRIAECFLGSDRPPQRRRQPGIGRERLAARQRAQRCFDDRELRPCSSLGELRSGLQLRCARQRAVEQTRDETAAHGGELALDAARGAFERRDIARGILVAGGRERLGGGGVIGSGHSGCAEV
jgi:hypothetical protein